MDQFPSIPTAVPTGPTIVAIATIAGVAVGGAISYFLDVRRERRIDSNRRISAAIAAVDSLDAFQRECLDKVAVLKKSTSFPEAKSGSENVRLPNLTVREHPELLAALPKTEARAILDLVTIIRDQNSRLEALRIATNTGEIKNEILSIRLKIETRGFADAAQTAASVQNRLAVYTDWKTDKNIIESIEEIFNEANESCYLLAWFSLFDFIQNLINKCGFDVPNNIDPLVQWADTVYSPIFGVYVSRALHSASADLLNIEEELDPKSNDGRHRSKHKAVESANKEILKVHPLYEKQFTRYINLNDISSLRNRIRDTPLPESLEPHINQVIQSYLFEMMKIVVDDPRNLSNS